MNHFELSPKLSIAFSCVIPSSMGPKAKLVEKPRKGKQQRYEEKREKRRSISMAEYQLLLLGRERSSMSEEDRNVFYSCEEEADTKEGMRMQIEDLQSQLGRSDLMRQKLQRQVLGLKLKINTLLSKREHMWGQCLIIPWCALSADEPGVFRRLQTRVGLFEPCGFSLANTCLSRCAPPVGKKKVFPYAVP